MANSTSNLLWFRLGHLLDWYETFSWSRVDILDMLFLGWLLAAFTVVGLINLYLKFFGHTHKPQSNFRTISNFSPGREESISWLNDVISWFSKHYTATPEFVAAWISSLNEQLRKSNVSI